MKRSWATVAGLSALALIAIGSTCQPAPRTASPPAGHTEATVLDNPKFVGHAPLDGFNDYGDLFAHGDFAYVGSRCSTTRQGGDMARSRSFNLVSLAINHLLDGDINHANVVGTPGRRAGRHPRLHAIRRPDAAARTGGGPSPPP